VTISNYVEVDGGDPTVEVRIDDEGRTYSGFITAHRQLDGMWEALVVYFAFVDHEPLPRRRSQWLPFGQLRLGYGPVG
jgi:hypothetical protein